jgi:beta-glucosidase
MENGFGAREAPNQAGQIVDQQRVAYLQSYTDAMRSAIQAGARVDGYFVWSLIDNFEWNSGYASRFGLAYVDYATQRRVPKSSFGWYATLIKESANLP